MFNTQLQSGVYSEQPVQQASGTEAAAGLASGLMGLGQTFFQAEAQREKSAFERQKLEMKLQADEKTFLENESTAGLVNALTMTLDGAPNLVSGTSVAQQLFMRAAESGEYTQQQLLSVSKELKSVYGVSLGGMARSASAEDLSVEKVQIERQQIVDNAVAFVGEFKVKYNDEVKPFLDSSGRIKSDLSPEDVSKLVALGQSIQTRESAEVAAIKSRYEGLQQRSKLESRNLAITLENVILSALPQIKAMPPGEGLASFDKTVSDFRASLAVNPNLLPEDIASHNAGMDAVVAIFRKDLTGERVNQANSDMQAQHAARLYNMTYSGSPTLQAVAALAAAGIPVSQEGSDAARASLISFIGENPNKVSFNASQMADDDGNVQGKPLVRLLGENWTSTFANPQVAVDNITLYTVNGKVMTQADIVSEQFETAFQPITEEEQQNFYGKNGVYLQVIKAWSQKPEALQNIGADVLSRPRVRESLLRSNSEGLLQYLPHAMNMALGFLGSETILADKIKVSNSTEGYPVLSGIEIPVVKGRTPRRDRSGKISLAGLNLEQQRYVEALEQVEQINTLFKMQHDAAVNLSKVTGDKKFVQDVIASQMNAISMYSTLSDIQFALGNLIPE
jgi:hypothetical protein